MAQKPDIKNRVARRVGGQSPRERRLDPPTRRGRAGLGRSGGAGQKHCDAGGFGGQGKAAARRQVERPNLPPQFDDGHIGCSAAGRLQAGLQGVRRIPRPHPDHPSGIEPKFGQSRRVDKTSFDIEKILPHPDQQAPPHDLAGQSQRKSGCRRGIRFRAGVDLMQDRPPESRKGSLLEGRGRKSLDRLFVRILTLEIENWRLKTRQRSTLRGKSSGLKHTMFLICSYKHPA